MDNNHDSFQHKVEDDGHYPATKIVGPKVEIFTEWFQEYMAADGDDLSEDSDIIRAVVSDELDVKFVEQRIEESGPRAPIVVRRLENTTQNPIRIGDGNAPSRSHVALLD
ncbi:hypothetical protein O988_05498 [Pseudogymnoascus sp. VKM F-3808]|nr:hypothetical protein O988_05498 [Pseudogymnoascus sp. VKM F-3808]